MVLPEESNEMNYPEHFGYSVSINKEFLLVGAIYGDGNKEDTGYVSVYRINNKGWTYENKIYPIDGSRDEKFGSSVSIDGEYAIIGADYYNGSVYFFKKTNDGWIQKNKFDGISNQSSLFGQSVSISGDYAIVGAPNENINNIVETGAAYIYHRNESDEWVHDKKLFIPEGGSYYRFGRSVSISGRYAIVGASQEVNIYHRNDDGWVLDKKILPNDEKSYGTSVSISGNHAMVGGNDAHIYQHIDTEWVQVEIDKQITDVTGTFVSINGDYAIVGSKDDQAAYILHRTENGWAHHETKLLSKNNLDEDWFGITVSISNDYAVVGAPLYKKTTNHCGGSIYIY